MAFMVLRETSSRLASSAWVQFFSARNTRMRFFMRASAIIAAPSLGTKPAAYPPADPHPDEQHLLDCHDEGDTEYEARRFRIPGARRRLSRLDVAGDGLGDRLPGRLRPVHDDQRRHG